MSQPARAVRGPAPPDPLLLATAIEAVVRAGEIQVAHVGRAMRVDKKGAIDLVTEVDLEVETIFRQMIAERFPGDEVLAEEFSRPGAPAGTGGRCWVFDPVDGTTNFAHGLPIFCASLGCQVDGRTDVAAVYDPTRRELFTAERGGGAYLNGAPLGVSEASSLLDSLLVTGFPYDVHQTADEVVGLFGEFIARARAVRRLGSAALDLCYLAAGRFDGFWEQGLKPWDTAAGALIVEEAGGLVTGWGRRPFAPEIGEIVASNGRIHEAMLATIDAFVGRRSGKRTT